MVQTELHYNCVTQERGGPTQRRYWNANLKLHKVFISATTPSWPDCYSYRSVANSAAQLLR